MAVIKTISPSVFAVISGLKLVNGGESQIDDCKTWLSQVWRVDLSKLAYVRYSEFADEPFEPGGLDGTTHARWQLGCGTITEEMSRQSVTADRCEAEHRQQADSYRSQAASCSDDEEGQAQAASYLRQAAWHDEAARLARIWWEDADYSAKAGRELVITYTTLYRDLNSTIQAAHGQVAGDKGYHGRATAIGA